MLEYIRPNISCKDKSEYLSIFADVEKALLFPVQSPYQSKETEAVLGNEVK